MMKKTEQQAPTKQPVVNENEQIKTEQKETKQIAVLPITVEVTDLNLRGNDNVLANANLVLNNCFVIYGVKLMTGKNGPFASMPAYKVNDTFYSQCRPITKELSLQMNEAMLQAYEVKLAETMEAHNQRKQQMAQQKEQMTAMSQEGQTAPWQEFSGQSM